MLPERNAFHTSNFFKFLSLSFVTESGHYSKKCLSCHQKKVKQSLSNSGHSPSFLRLLATGDPIIMEDTHTYTQLFSQKVQSWR